MKRTRFTIAVLVLLTVALSGCATWGQPAGAVPRTPYQQAELAYRIGADGYAANMQLLQQLQAAGKLPLPLWRTGYQIQTSVQAAQPLVRHLLDTWKASGIQPAEYSIEIAKLTAEFTRLALTIAEATK